LIAFFFFIEVQFQFFRAKFLALSCKYLRFRSFFSGNFCSYERKFGFCNRNGI